MIDADIVVAATIACEVPPYPEHEFGELAIGLAIEGVCEVIGHRVELPGFPKTAVEVVLAPKAFSCVRGLLWPQALAGRWHPAHVERCLLAWRAHRQPPILEGPVTHYYSPVSMIPPGSVPPWAASMTEVRLVGVPLDWFRWFRAGGS